MLKAYSAKAAEDLQNILELKKKWIFTWAHWEKLLAVLERMCAAKEF